MTVIKSRILHVFRAPLGGLFRHVIDLTREQIARGYAVGIFCDSTTGGERADVTLAELAPKLELGLARVPMSRNPSLSDFAALAALARTYRASGANVLHAHGSKGGAYARLLPLGRSGRETIRAYTPHGGSFNYKPGTSIHRAYMTIERMLQKRTELFLFESEYIAGRFRSYVGATDALTRIVHNGISEAEFEPIDKSRCEFDLLYIGEMRTAKGVDVLIDAIATLRQQGRRLTLLAVGSGPDTQELTTRAESAGVADAIRFEPPQAIRCVLGRASVMVIPSRAESLPYVILEAAAAAQPMVSTNVGGIPEIFVPLLDELIRPDDRFVLADAIARKLDESAETRDAKARMLSDFVRRSFSVQQMIDDVQGGYSEAFARKRSPAAAALALEPR